MIKCKALEIIKLWNIIKWNDLDYKSAHAKIYNFSKYSLPTVFMREIHIRYLKLGTTDDEQSSFANELKNLDKGPKLVKEVISK